jgi:cytidine deaminase
MSDSEFIGDLLAAASKVRLNAYAPYSRYKVGAAVLDDRGNVWLGCNVENVSYGAAICAERTAVAKMISDGGRVIRAIAVATADGGTPCGICLQTLLEFSPDPNSVEVYTLSDSGNSVKYALGELIPHGFRSEEVIRTL